MTWIDIPQEARPQQLKPQTVKGLIRKARKVAKQKGYQQPNYREYMKSRRWRGFRKHYWNQHPKVCAACRATTNIDIHHLHYARLGRERDEDVVPLCRTCHDEYHHAHGVSAKMIKPTVQFIEEKATADLLKWI